MAEFYKNQGYDFLFITDHNFLTSVGRLNAVYGKESDFLVIQGVEVSKRFEGKSVHVCALNPERLLVDDLIVDDLVGARTRSDVPFLVHGRVLSEREVVRRYRGAVRPRSIRMDIPRDREHGALEGSLIADSRRRRRGCCRGGRLLKVR